MAVDLLLLKAVDIETGRAESIHGPIPSLVRGMVIMMEEVGEASMSILEATRAPKGEADQIIQLAFNELIQVAAVAVRMAQAINEGMRE